MADTSIGATIGHKPAHGRCALFPGLAVRRIGDVSPLDNQESKIAVDGVETAEGRMDHAFSAATAEKVATHVEQSGATE